VRYQDLDTGDTSAILPGAQVQLPGDLWEIKFGPTYRHKFENGWIAGLNVQVGSSSNRPFHSIDEVTARDTAFLRVPKGERNAWIFTLNYTNYSEYFSGFPVPGIDFLYSPNDDFTLVFGFPFVGFPFDGVEVDLLADFLLEILALELRVARSEGRIRCHGQAHENTRTHESRVHAVSLTV